MIELTTSWQRFDAMLYRLESGVLLAMPDDRGAVDPALRELAGEVFEVDFDRCDPDDLPTLRLIRRLLEAEALLELWLSSAPPSSDLDRKILEARTILFLPVKSGAR